MQAWLKAKLKKNVLILFKMSQGKGQSPWENILKLCYQARKGFRHLVDAVRWKRHLEALPFGGQDETRDNLHLATSLIFPVFLESIMCAVCHNFQFPHAFIPPWRYQWQCAHQQNTAKKHSWCACIYDCIKVLSGIAPMHRGCGRCGHQSSGALK